MGKQKRQRRKPHKQNPTGLISEKDFEELEDVSEETKEKALLRVLEQVRYICFFFFARIMSVIQFI